MAVSIDSYSVGKNCSKKPIHRIKEVRFGDGYVQRAPDGINYDYEEWNVEFAPLSSLGAATLEGYLANSVTGIANILSWTPLGEGTAKYWTAGDISKSPGDEDFWQITCTLKREFPLS